MNASVYIVVLNWNQCLLTIECIRSLLNLDYQNYRIVVVDNGSTDSTVEKLCVEFGKQIDLLVNAENFGFSKGNNVGIQFALAQNAKYVMLLNNDTVVEDRQLLNKLVGVNENDSTGMSSPSIFYYDNPSQVWYAGSEVNLWKGWRHHYKIPKDKNSVETGYASGCCVLVSSQLIRQIGLLNEVYFFSVEDLEWSLRAKQAGWRIAYVPNASVLHKDSVSSKARKGKGTYSSTRVYYEHRNTIWLVREYATPIQKWTIWPIRFVSQWIYKLSAYVILQRWDKSKALLRAIKDGLLTPLPKFQFQR